MRISFGSITADPNPVPVSDFGNSGFTTLAWTCEKTAQIEVRSDAPDGPVVVKGGPSGKIRVSKFGMNGTTFYLQDVSRGAGLSREHTLDRVTVYLCNTRFTGNLSSRIASTVDLWLASQRSEEKVLVAGWFSFDMGGTTAGDLMARDVTCRWLQEAGYSYDVAMANSLPGGVDWQEVEPQSYSQVIFVCGPFAKNPLSVPFLQRFRDCRLIGLNLSMTEPLDIWALPGF